LSAGVAANGNLKRLRGIRKETMMMCALFELGAISIFGLD